MVKLGVLQQGSCDMHDWSIEMERGGRERTAREKGRAVNCCTSFSSSPLFIVCSHAGAMRQMYRPGFKCRHGPRNIWMPMQGSRPVSTEPRERNQAERTKNTIVLLAKIPLATITSPYGIKHHAKTPLDVLSSGAGSHPSQRPMGVREDHSAYMGRKWGYLRRRSGATRPPIRQASQAAIWRGMHRLG